MVIDTGTAPQPEGAHDTGGAHAGRHRRRAAEARPVQTTEHPDSFGARASLRVGNRTYTYYRLDALAERGFNLATLLEPFSLKVLLENLLRFEDGRSVLAG